MVPKKWVVRGVKMLRFRPRVVLKGRSRGILRARSAARLARVVKLVDTGDLKSPGHRGRAGSSPAPGTNQIQNTMTPSPGVTQHLLFGTLMS